MKFLMIHLIEEAVSFPAAVEDEEDPAQAKELAAWVAEMEASGVKLHGGHLQPTRYARTVRVQDGELIVGEVLVSDGPYAETKEQIAGFDVIECASMDEAIRIAARHPTARIGSFELRPFWE